MDNYHKLKEFIKIAAAASIVKRSAKVALIVGTILMFINHGDAIFAGKLNGLICLKILLTYFVPFLVSTQARVSATIDAKKL